MEGIGTDKTLNRLAFMKDKIGMNVGIDQAIIYCRWLRSVNQIIAIFYRRIAAKMAYARNGSWGGSGHGSFGAGHGLGPERIENLVESSCKQVVKDIVEEINENMVVIYAQLSRLGKDMELLHKTVEGLCIDVLSVQQKVNNIKIKVETMTVGVLKEVFEVRDATAINVIGSEVATVVRVLDEEEDVMEELTTFVDDPAGEEVKPGCS